MSQWRLVTLQFGRNSAHFGEVGIGTEATSERLRSDTLFSAIITAYAQLWGKAAVAELLSKFLNEPTPPFRISSTFLYHQQDDQLHYYLPRPLQFPPGYPLSDAFEFSKTYKQLNYLPLDIWRSWYQIPHNFSRTTVEAVHPDKTYKRAYKIQQVPKVSLDRISQAGNFFHTGFVHYCWQASNDHIQSLSGLYFLLHLPDSPTTNVTETETLEHRLKAVLCFLGEDGIGGERSTGAGRFQVDWQPLPEIWQSVIDFDQGDHHCLVSLYWDEQSQQDWQTQLSGASYTLQERGGWVTTPFSGRQLRRQCVQMFTEGSVFQPLPRGQIVDVTPGEFRARGPHPIYRNGIALSLPINVLNPQGADHEPSS